MARSGFSRLTARTRSAYKLDGLRARGNARSVCLIGPPWSVMPARRPRRLRACSASRGCLKNRNDRLFLYFQTSPKVLLNFFAPVFHNLVNFRKAARGGFLQVKKPPCINKIRNRFSGRQPAWAGMFFLTAAAERAILIRVRNHILFLRCCFYNKKR